MSNICQRRERGRVESSLRCFPPGILHSSQSLFNHHPMPLGNPLADVRPRRFVALCHSLGALQGRRDLLHLFRFHRSGALACIPSSCDSSGYSVLLPGRLGHRVRQSFESSCILAINVDVIASPSDDTSIRGKMLSLGDVRHFSNELEVLGFRGCV